jgi:hypothetical protein
MADGVSVRDVDIGLFALPIRGIFAQPFSET